MSINLTDELQAKTKKGKIASAKQVFLEGDTQTVEKEIQDINSRHNELSSKHESLSSTVSDHAKQIESNQSQIAANKSAQDEKNASLDANMAKLNTRDDQITELVKGVTATGGASVATAVTYDNTSSQLASATVQGAVDELQNSKISKTSISQEFGESEDKVMSQKYVSIKFSEISNKTEQIKNEEVKDEVQSVRFTNDDGTKIIHTIDENHADFTNLQSSGKKVLTEDDTAEYVSKKYVESELGKKQDKVDGLFNKETTDKSDEILFASDDYDGNGNGELYTKIDKDGVYAKAFLPLSLKQITLSYPKRIFTVFNDFGIDAYDTQIKNMYNASGYHNAENKKIGQQTFPWNINSRSYSIDLWLDNMLSNLTEEPKIGFGNVEGNNKVSFFQHGSKDGGTYINSDTINGNNTIFELDQTFEVGGNDYSSQTINIKQISVKSSASRGKKCILLPIGDSTVNGTNAYINTPYPTSPYQWWAWTKAYFDMDKIEDAEQVEMKTIGITSANTYDIKLSGLEKNNIRTYGMGIGGSNASTWRASEMTASGGSGYPNAFMNNGVFSINYFLENWRTCDDNGVRLYTDSSKSTTKSEGTSVKGYYDDGTESTFYIGKLVTDTSACDVCLPTHIAIQLGFNGMNFDDYDAIISDIHSEYPNIPIILQLMDSPGTYFVSKYQEYCKKYGIFSCDYTIGLAKTYHNNFVSINNQIMERENESNNIYYCPSFFVQPSVFAVPTAEYMNPAAFARNNIELTAHIEIGSTPHLHPNNVAHACAGYEMYALLKWLLIK